MTSADLKTRTRKELARMARRSRITGWHSMRKDELIRALVAWHRHRQDTDCPATAAGRLERMRTNTTSATRRPEQPRNGASNGTRSGTAEEPGEDRLVAEACDTHWIHASWQLSPAVLRRAAAALGIEWRRAVPVLRVFDITADDASIASRTWLQDIEVDGQTSHWYIPVMRRGRTYRLALGYRTPGGRFFALVHSPPVRMPLLSAAPSSTAPLRTSGGQGTARFRIPLDGLATVEDDCGFGVQVELVVHGTAPPNSDVTLCGETVPVAQDGTFSLRCALPDGRQVVPVVATDPDGVAQRTIVLAFERNTRHLEPHRADDPLA